jgi:hypothetical protein
MRRSLVSPAHRHGPLRRKFLLQGIGGDGLVGLADRGVLVALADTGSESFFLYQPNHALAADVLLPLAEVVMHARLP